MSLFGRSVKQNWNKTSNTTYATNETHRGYTAIITIVSTGYSLAITGTGAPGAAIYATLKLAKSAFAKYLRAK